MSQNLAERIRPDFPILSSTMSGKPLAYLDNGATTQKPQSVIDAITHYYCHDNANIHRGLYALSQRATDGYEASRHKVAQFIHASSPEECIFVKGTTEAINLVATSWGLNQLQADDEVVITGLEHHSNIVPWQMACAATRARLRVWLPEQDGSLSMGKLVSLLNERTKMVAVQHVSNALGNVHDVAEIARLAKTVGARVLVDGAQWVGHYPTDVQKLGCDFYAFSGHKLYAPTGIGVLWGRRELLESLPPYQGGGDMIETVTFEKTTYAELPNRFEAGTPNISGVIGLGAAIDYVQGIGFEALIAHEDKLLTHATRQLQAITGLRILGPVESKAAVISFVLENPSIAPLDVAAALSDEGIAVRTGHHCCMPLMSQLHVGGTCRISLAMYNTVEEIDRLVEVLRSLVAVRRKEHSQAEPGKQVGIEFAAAAADSVQAASEQLTEEFLDFDDRESKTELMMELGQRLPDHFETLKAISTAVPGCMSEVYLIGRPVPGDDARFEFAADSNAQIVRGLIAVLQQLFSGQPAADVVDFDLERFFRGIGLDQFVSTQRRSGLNGMVQRIRTLAKAIIERQVADPS